MEIADTTLYVDAMRVMANRNTKPNTTLSYALVLPDEVIDPFYQASKTIRRDYIVGYADEIELVLAFGIGTYAKRILPNRANLKVRVTKIFNSTIARELDTEQDTQSMEFTAILSDVGQNPTDRKSVV